MDIGQLFSLQDRVAIVTGGTGVLGGAKVGILGRRAEMASAVAATINDSGGQAMPLPANVLDMAQLQAAREAIVAAWGRVDILVNAAGGNVPGANVADDQSFFDLRKDALKQVVALNLHDSIQPTQVFGEIMAQCGTGAIVNISSMAAQKPLTRVVGYAVAKAALDNFTKWLATELAQKYGPNLRVDVAGAGGGAGSRRDGAGGRAGLVGLGRAPYRAAVVP